MKQYIPIFLFLFYGSTLSSQDLTGIWRGSFYNVREMLLGGSKYRYEVQIDNNGKGIKGVTYSYQTTRFYGKASLIGMWTPSTQNLVMKEEKMEDLKIEGGGEGCLMTCYLDYHKEGDKEYLEGTYSSRNMNTGVDCGGGKVYLERVIDSDFEKEDFLEKKNKKSTTKIKPGQEDFLLKGSDSEKVTSAKTVPPPVVKKPAPAPKSSATKPVAKAAPAKKPVTKPTAPATAKKTTPKPPVSSTKKAGTPPPTAKKQTVPPPKTPVKKEPDPVIASKPVLPPSKAVTPPPVLKLRTNELFETINTSAREIVISFYDNGEIDGDTISVYDNNRLLVRAKRLSAQPITLKVLLGEEDANHEIIMVAENLGSIPPNTALMIVEAGDQRYTVRLSSTEQKNAMVRFRYEAEGK